MHVYVINNTVNGKMYVGQHAGDDLDWYFRENIAAALRGNTSKRFLYRAIRKYGPEAFNIRSIYSPIDKSDMDNGEIAYIKLFGTRNHELGYNLTDGGDGVSGLVHSEETREKLRQAAIKRGVHPNFRSGQKEYLKTRIITDETKEKISIGRTGKKASEATKQKQREAKIGKKRTLEAIEKSRIGNLGKHKGPQTDEWKAKISEANAGREYSLEVRQRVSEAMKASWARRKALKEAVCE